MEAARSFLKPKPTAPQQLREWQRRLYIKGHNIERKVIASAGNGGHQLHRSGWPSPKLDVGTSRLPGSILSGAHRPAHRRSSQTPRPRPTTPDPRPRRPPLPHHLVPDDTKSAGLVFRSSRPHPLLLLFFRISRVKPESKKTPPLLIASADESYKECSADEVPGNKKSSTCRTSKSKGCREDCSFC